MKEVPAIAPWGVVQFSCTWWCLIKAWNSQSMPSLHYITGKREPDRTGRSDRSNREPHPRPVQSPPQNWLWSKLGKIGEPVWTEPVKPVDRFCFFKFWKKNAIISFIKKKRRKSSIKTKIHFFRTLILLVCLFAIYS